MNHLRADIVVVGAGIAGLTVALKAAPKRVTVLCKTRLGSGSATDWAQGGIAAAMGGDDSPALHKMDTQRAGAGLSEEAIVEILTRDAPARVDDLLELGASFDRTKEGGLALGREAAHNRRRIVKAGGDATGHEILRTLIAAVHAAPSITIMEDIVADDLIVAEGRVLGIYAHAAGNDEQLRFEAAATVLATGGIGRLYRHTTNPIEASGDGIAMAARAGATLADMEFVQFHPTALAVGADPMPLVTEAIRGEGATLRNDLGERFMLDLHPDAELAPRDIVARAIFAQQRAGRSVGLDARSALGETFPARFPTVFASCMSAGIDPRAMAIPVSPAAHYLMGGIAVDQWGRTSLPGLWACGETSATGVHGANRLASNSLLEALVYATRVADDVARAPVPAVSPVIPPSIGYDVSSADCIQGVVDLRNVMYTNVGLVREGAGLEAALRRIIDLGEAYPAKSAELRNLLTVGSLISQAALARRESRGSHYRSDYPRTDAAFAKRSFTKL
ncbi:MAG: L-aspartate oxidase, partial [Candidatus Eremiobacteraeota bacterium]|nr:L-aspartate oxidase [Candidatus Eremiobacteraeota bacterium]